VDEPGVQFNRRAKAPDDEIPGEVETRKSGEVARGIFASAEIAPETSSHCGRAKPDADLPHPLPHGGAYASGMKFLRGRTGQLLGGAVGLIVIGVVFFVVLPSIANPREVWNAVRELSWPWLLALAAAALLNVVTFAPPYMAALPGLKFRPALTVTTASTASTYLAPGGFAVGMGLSFAMLRAWGFRGRPVTIAVTLATVWNQFMVFGTPVVALALLTYEGGSHPLLGTIAWLGLAIFAAVVAGFGLSFRSAKDARRFGDFASRVVSRGLEMIKRGPARWTGETFVEFRNDTVGIVRQRWQWLTASTIVGHLSVYVVLIVTLRALHVTQDEVTVIESFAAWALVRVLGAIPITPGGFGIVELGMTGALVAFGAPQAEAVAAVLVYRFLTVAPPLVLGAMLGATFRRQHPGWAREVEAA